MKRYFKLVDIEEDNSGIIKINNEFGRFSGRTPKQAASKALSQIYMKKKYNGGQVYGEHYFSIIECTRSKDRKIFSYIGKRNKLNHDLNVQKKNDYGGYRIIRFQYQNSLKRDPDRPIKNLSREKRNIKDDYVNDNINYNNNYNYDNDDIIVEI